MSTALSLEDQAALDLHNIMLEAMRARESEILRFIGFLLTAIAGFIAAAGLFIDKERIVYAELLMPMLFGIIILILGLLPTEWVESASNVLQVLFYQGLATYGSL